LDKPRSILSPGDWGGKKWWTTVLVVILLTSFALRVVGLDRWPLWWDEGISVYFAHQNPPAILDEMQATNHADPPIYVLALSGWRMLTGSSPFAFRFFSVLLGVVTVTLTWTIGRWLTDKRIALLATLFVALAPMQVYYSREAKSYTFATACALLSTYAWGRGLGYRTCRLPLARSASQTRWWIVYGLSTAAAVGAHYYVGLLVLWQGLWVVGKTWLAWTHESLTRYEALARLRQWLLVVILAALILMPWTLALFSTTVRGVHGLSRHESLSLWSYLAQVGSALGAGPDAKGAAALIASVGLAALGIIGARIVNAPCSHGRRGFLSTWVAVPLAAAYLMQSAYSFFFPRFLLYLGTAYYLLVGRGIAALGRRLSATIAVIVLVASIGLWAPGLARIYSEPADKIEDPRPAIARIRAVAQPGDAFVYVYIWQAGYLLGYYPQNELDLYRAYYTPQTVGTELESIFAHHPRLWLLSYRIAAEEAHNLSASWLEAEAYKVESNWYGQHNLALYLAPDFRTPGVGPEENIASFDGRIELRHPLVSAQLSPGDVLALPLRWRTLATFDEDYSVFVHLGLPDTPPLVQSDGPPHNGLNPTGDWVADQEVIDQRALLLPDTIPPGRYAVTVGLYRPSDGNRLPVSGADGLDALLLGYVEIER
jgi:4-amino-4-deoxy-L-arabinose transferase-like glycosyltransferase